MITNTKKSVDNVRENGKIMEIKVNRTSKTEVLTGVKSLISHNRKFYIVTPNPELILMAQKNKELKTALNEADFAVPDAIGLSQAAKYLSLDLPKQKFLRVIIGFFQGLYVGAATFLDRKWLTGQVKPVKGRVLFLGLTKLADKNGWKVFLLGGLGEEAETASRKLQTRYPKLQTLSFAGPKLDKDAEPATKADKEIEKDSIDKINKFEPDLLFVAFGNPKQEIWIHKNLQKLNIGGAMAVGGAFRYAAGSSSLPPKWMEKVGLEWFWRLITEPARAGRIFRAVVLFPLRVFWTRIAED